MSVGVIVAIALALLAVVLFGVAGIAGHSGRMVRVPNVVGKPLAGAVEVLDEANLTVGRARIVDSAGTSPGIVVGQSPAAGSDVRPHTHVSLRVAVGGGRSAG